MDSNASYVEISIHPKGGMKELLPGQIQSEARRSLSRGLHRSETEIDELVKRVRDPLELGAFKLDKPKFELTGSFLSPPFNTAGALTYEEIAFAILEIEKAHQKFDFEKGLRREEPDSETLNQEQALVVMLALQKNSRAPITGSPLGRSILHHLSVGGRSILDTIFPHNPITVAEKHGIRYDVRNNTVGSTEERLNQLSTEVGNAAKSYYQHLPEMIRVPAEQLYDDIKKGKLDEEAAYKRYDAMKSQVLKGLGLREHKMFATMEQILSYLHPDFISQLEDQQNTRMLLKDRQVQV